MENKVNYSEIMNLGFRTIRSFIDPNVLVYQTYITDGIQVEWDEFEMQLNLYVNYSFMRKITLEELKFLLEVHGK